MAIGDVAVVVTL